MTTWTDNESGGTVWINGSEPVTTWTDNETGGNVYSDEEPSANDLDASDISFLQSGSGASSETVQDQLRLWVRPEQFDGVGDGATNDRAAIAAADTRATSSGCVLFAAGKTYLCSTSLTITAACYFEPGAQISIPVGQTITFSGRVISLGGTPTTGSGTTTYSHDGNVFFNSAAGSGGFGFGTAVPSGTDDFVHIQRDVNTSVGILIKNRSTGSAGETFLHLFSDAADAGGSLRMSANSIAGGALVDIVASQNEAFSIIQASNMNIDFYANNLRSFQIKPSGGTTVNFGNVKGGAAGSAVQYDTDGTDTDISVIYNLKGAGSHFFRTAGGAVYQFEIKHVASATNRVYVQGSNGGNPVIGVTGGALRLGESVDVQWGIALVSLGGGAAPTLGTIGGSGPATAGQNSWMRVLDSGGAAFWVPTWK